MEGEQLSAKVNCSDINDELGQINYVLSDKPGTLPENEMHFRACSLGGTLFEKESKVLRRKDTDLELLPHHDPAVYQFFLALSLCHTVQAKVGKRSALSSPELENIQSGML